MIRGSCLCGQIRYELEGGVEFIDHCHCSMCRKAHGSAFGAFLHARAGGFRWTSGEELVTRYDSPWFEIVDALPQFERFPPQEFWAMHDDR